MEMAVDAATGMAGTHRKSHRKDRRSDLPIAAAPPSGPWPMSPLGAESCPARIPLDELYEAEFWPFHL